MRMIQKILSNTNKRWNKLPKDIPAIQIEQGTGKHRLITIDEKGLYLHSTIFRDDLPVKQTVLLDDYTLPEIVDVLNTMGYTATVCEEASEAGILQKKAFILMEVTNSAIENGLTLQAFTSPTWDFLYPIARVLREAERYAEAASLPLIAAFAKGSWLDYWATFFNLKRYPSEPDTVLARRVLVALSNMKSVNIALQDILELKMGTSVRITDKAPALIGVDIDADWMGFFDDVRAIIEDVKAGGVDYEVGYRKQFEERYRAHFADRYGIAFSDSGQLASELAWELLEWKYGYDNFTLDAFTLDQSELDTGQAMLVESRMRDTVKMTMTLDGVVVQEAKMG